MGIIRIFWLIFAIGLKSYGNTTLINQNGTPLYLNKAKEEADILNRIHLLENRIIKIENDLKSKGVTDIDFINRLYIKSAFSLLIPFNSSFPCKVDNGIGVLLAFGKHIGKNNVFELGFQWDVYFALSLSYRYQFYIEPNSIILAPIIGLRHQIGKIKPFDNFIEDPNLVKSLFPYIGLVVGIQLPKNTLLNLEPVFLINDQKIFTFITGITIYL